ncbi:ABC transporter permease [Luteimonas marina]|uniref:ABC transporter permease n=1 Tax=Luteimonas marina TaxID=488485 RepID=A0A5C5TYC0_9GAMM|nr:ABC transporter permease [Luteimonas marina]TWT18714.1 ABC transporter permease [Luteimonas marina]
MIRYLFNRAFLAIPTLLVVAVIVFAMMRAIPGDPAQLMLGEVDNPKLLADLREKLGLDLPVPAQFVIWIKQLLAGDLGISISQQRPVLEILIGSFGVTASLVLPAILLASLVAVPAGMLAGWRQNTPVDVSVVALAVGFLSIPAFWLGLLFLLVFGLWLDLFPVVGYVPLVEDFAEGVKYLVLPVIALALIEAGVLIRLARSSTIEVLRQEYITHARAKGLTELAVAGRHAFKNSMAPTLTMIGLTLGSLLGGAVVTETVFTLPGLGRLLVESIFARDYPVVQGCLLLVTLVYVVVNLLVDLCYPLFDPRVRL